MTEWIDVDYRHKPSYHMVVPKWIDVSDYRKPPCYRVILCYCPDWCDESYQIARWDGKKFEYDSQPNNDFDKYVQSWCLFLEAE